MFQLTLTFSMTLIDVNLPPMGEARKLFYVKVILDIKVKFKTSDQQRGINIWMLSTTYSISLEIPPFRCLLSFCCLPSQQLNLVKYSLCMINLFLLYVRTSTTTTSVDLSSYEGHIQSDKSLSHMDISYKLQHPMTIKAYLLKAIIGVTLTSNKENYIIKCLRKISKQYVALSNENFKYTTVLHG